MTGDEVDPAVKVLGGLIFVFLASAYLGFWGFLIGAGLLAMGLADEGGSVDG